MPINILTNNSVQMSSAKLHEKLADLVSYHSQPCVNTLANPLLAGRCCGFNNGKLFELLFQAMNYYIAAYPL